MRIKKILALCLLGCLLLPGQLYGEEQAKEQAIDEVLVESERLVETQDTITIKSEGLPADVNVITKEDLKAIPYTGSYLDLFKQVPGMYVTRYTGGDYGDRIGMRGFSGGHGVQIAFFVDGMPMNVLDYTHGMNDLVWLLPEMVERIEIIKGPFSALYGDFALGGVVNIITKKCDPSPSITLNGGTYTTGQSVGILSDSRWSPTPFLVWEGYTRQGYRLDNQYKRGQFFNKLTFPLFNGNLSGRIHYVARTWGDPGYISINDIKANLTTRRNSVNGADRGDSEMFDVVFNYKPKGGEEGFHGDLWYAYHSNNTGRTFPPSPQSRKDTFENYFGWKLLYDYRPFESVSIVAGNDLRYDQVSQNQWSTISYYNFLKQTALYKFHQFSTGFFAQAQYKPFSFAKFVGGLRWDQFQVDIDNQLYRANSGNASPNKLSPKVGFVLTPYKDVNIFANYGQGFRSPSVTQWSPASSTQRANYDMGLAELETYDAGFNALVLDKVYLAFDYYITRYSGEQWLNPITATYDNLGTSKRNGMEFEIKIFITKELTLYGNYACVRARLTNPTTAGAYYITGVPPEQSVVGLEYQKSWANGEQQVGFSFYYNRMGRTPYNTSGTIIGSQFDQYMSKITYQYKKWLASLNITLTPRTYASDICTVSNNQLCYTPWPKWEVFGGLKYRFY